MAGSSMPEQFRTVSVKRNGVAIGVAVEIGMRKARNKSDCDPNSDADPDNAVQAALSGSALPGNSCSMIMDS
jgi:hypothetical protein